MIRPRFRAEDDRSPSIPSPSIHIVRALASAVRGGHHSVTCTCKGGGSASKEALGCLVLAVSSAVKLRQSRGEHGSKIPPSIVRWQWRCRATPEKVLAPSGTVIQRTRIKPVSTSRRR